MGTEGCSPLKSRHLETHPDTVCIASTLLLLDCVFRMALYGAGMEIVGTPKL